MALAARDYWTVSATLKDDDGATSRFSVNCVEPGIDVGYPVIALWAQVVVGLVEELSNCALQNMTISKEYVSDDRVPAAESDVENAGVFLVETAGGYKGRLSIPGILEDVLIASGALTGIQIDTSLSDVADFIEAITTDYDTTPLGLAGEVHAVDSRGMEIQSVYDAYKQNRSSFKSRGGRG